MPADEKQPFYASCSSCDHKWVFIWLPMELSTAAKVMKGLRCPRCGNASKGLHVHMPGKEEAQ